MKREAKKTVWFNTTIGEFVEAVYDAAMEEFMDEIMARRIAMQVLLRSLRHQHKLAALQNQSPDGSRPKRLPKG